MAHSSGAPAQACSKGSHCPADSYCEFSRLLNICRRERAAYFRRCIEVDNMLLELTRVFVVAEEKPLCANVRETPETFLTTGEGEKVLDEC